MISAIGKAKFGAREAAGAHHRQWWIDVRIIAPVVAVVVYVVTVVVRLPSALSTIYWYSDFPSALQLGDAVFHGAWGQGLQVRSQSGLVTLWIVGLLNQLTGSSAASMALGGVMLIGTAGFLAGATRRALGTRGAVLAGALCVAAPPVVAWEVLSPLAHESTLLITAVCAWHLVAMAQPRPKRMLASSLLVGVLAGACVASDTLAVAAAAIPWILCATVIALHRPERRVSLVATGGAAIASAVAIALIANLNGIVAIGDIRITTSITGISAGLRTTASTVAQMVSGAWYGDSLPAVAEICGVALFVGILYLAVREVRHRSTDTMREIYVWFWILSAGGLIAALCLSGLGIQYSPINYQGHYVNGIWLVVAALLPAAAIRVGSWQRIGAAAVTALALIGAAGLARMPATLFEGPDYRDASRLTATLTALGVTHGYGGFWESYAIGWHTNQRISVLPLQTCTDASGVTGLCRYEFAPPALYRTQPGPVFVVALSVPCEGDKLCISVADLADLPKPEAVRTVGLLQVYVYAHDSFAQRPVG